MSRPLDQMERNMSSGEGGPPSGGFSALVPELDVTDRDRSLSFWCGLLGFEIAYDRKAAGFAYLQRDGAQIMLCRINGEWMTGALERPFGRGVNFQIAVSDAASIAGRVERAGWPLFRGLTDAVYRIGGMECASREFLVQDPDGYLVRLSQSVPVPAA